MTRSRPDSITFVCCIEHGRLEDETLLMLETLRMNGGALAEARVIAVVGRRGAPLAGATIRALERLDVELVHDRAANPAPWFNYANKVAAVQIAQARATTPLVAWLDSDVLIAAEPRGLLLPEGIDFGGRCEFLPPAVHAGSRLHVPYWERLCALAGAKLDDLPLVRIDHLGVDIRLNFNSGVFVWRRGSTFAQAYKALFVALLESRLAQHDGNFFTTDQVIIAPLLLANGLSWKHLDLVDHHMIFQKQLEGPGASPDMSRSRVVHYSRSLNPPFRPAFLKRLEAELPALFAHLQARGRAADEKKGFAARWLILGLKAYRNLRWKLYAARVRRAPRGA
ncbi:MAG: hypothetical protein ABW032_00940 [Burkholderiaceae bacterium]